MIVKLLTEHHLEFKLKRRLKGSSESTHVKMPHCWNNAMAHILCKKCPYFSSVYLEYSMIVKRLTEHHLEFLSLKGG